jgi:hypothetical protein
MNRTLAGEWLLRILTAGVSALSGWLGLRYGAEIGGAAAVIATAAATKAVPYLIPTAEKVAAANQIPKPVTIRKGLPGS